MNDPSTVTEHTEDHHPSSGPELSPRPEVSLRESAERQIARARIWIRQNPLPALGIALASGFVVGRVLRR